MVTRRRVAGVVVLVIAVLLLVGLAVYLAAVGLDKADKVASVIGAFVGLVGLSVACVELVRSRDRPRVPRPDVTNTIVGSVSGNVIQAGTINGDIDVGRRD